ncbi:proliferating cell nuclear antigen [Serendipita vermifera]|nr:proliferating cell nuclear antigen [Serendipita vermifera]
MLEAKLAEAQTIKRLIDAIKDLVTDGNWDCNDEGMALQAMDNSHVALVSVRLKPEGFIDYRCDRPITLGTNIASLTKVLKCAKDDDVVTLTANDAADMLQLKYESKTSDRLSDYTIKLMDIDAEHLGIPETDYDATVEMPAAEFARLCRDLGALGESVLIEVSKEGVRFKSEGDAATGSVLMKGEAGSGGRSGGSSSRDKKMKVKKEEEDTQMDEDASEDDGGAKSDNEDEDEEEESSSKKRKRSKTSSEKTKGKTKKVRTSDAEDDGDTTGVKIMMSQSVSLTFSLKYLQNFAKSSTLCNRVVLSMSNDVPLLVAYDFGQGSVRYYLAPKIGDEA